MAKMSHTTNSAFNRTQAVIMPALVMKKRSITLLNPCPMICSMVPFHAERSLCMFFTSAMRSASEKMIPVSCSM